jgi:N-acetylmuramoyl-L-alanine amidase
MKIIQHPSPNFNDREGHAVDMLVLHYTGMKSGLNAIDRMCDTTAEVSAHYMIEEDGRIFQLVDESMRAWHAGKSYWRGHTNINQRSIGIELVNPGHEFGYRDFPEVQMQSVIWLCKEILVRHDIPARNVVGHSDVAPVRKDDPGERFPWQRLAGEGIGLWPNEGHEKWTLLKILVDIPLSVIPLGFCWFSKKEKIAYGDIPENAEVAKLLAQYGYDVTDLPKTITAFQRHFHPARITGQWDRVCGVRLQGLFDKIS